MVMKRSDDLKTRGCTNRSYQRAHYGKYENSSPTPDFCTFKHICSIIAREGRDTATAYLPGLFLQTEHKGDERSLLKLTGEVALLLVESDPIKWEKYLRRDDGKWVLHAVCDRATHGTLNDALLSYKKLAKTFKEWDLIMNPYDPCVCNKEEKCKQLTIMFHIDNVVMDHLDAIIVTKCIKKLDEKHGANDPLTVARGKVHKHLGMTVDFSLKLGTAISQYDFCKKLRSALPEGLKGRHRKTRAPDFHSRWI